MSGVRDDVRPKPYFNTGVLVMNLPAWRGTGMAQRALRYAAEGAPLRWADQDALNAVLDNWFELESRWNVQHGNLFSPCYQPDTPRTAALYHDRRDLYAAAAVLHFVGRAKPWSHLCTAPGTAAWVRSLVRSGWYTETGA